MSTYRGETLSTLNVILIASTVFCAAAIAPAQPPLIIDHNHTDMTAEMAPTQADYQLAKDTLHIAYGHTSHGSQLTTGMNGLVDFINGGGLGLSYPTDFFEWNNGGSGGALDLHDYAMDGDCGYYPQWYNNSVDYLDNPSYDDVNVIIWSWCGQVDSKYAAGLLDDHYLDPMTQLELDYPDVVFVYMTGHVDHWDDTNNKAANQMIRDYCIANNKVLFDFADIESWDPEGVYYEWPHDNCDHYASLDGAKLGNWATSWQDSHTEGTAWYSCSSAHSEPLNANRKAYAAWALWAAIAERILAGDMDCSGDVDVAVDLPLFVDALLDPDGYAPPGSCSLSRADMNDDDDVDGKDIPGFLAVLIP